MMHFFVRSLLLAFLSGRDLRNYTIAIFPGSAVSIRVVRGYLGLEDQLGFSDGEGSEIG